MHINPKRSFPLDFQPAQWFRVFEQRSLLLYYMIYLCCVHLAKGHLQHAEWLTILGYSKENQNLEKLLIG